MPRTFMGRCQRLGHCGYIDCMCDVDPTDPRDVAAWRKEEAREAAQWLAEAEIVIPPAPEDVKH